MGPCKIYLHWIKAQIYYLWLCISHDWHQSWHHLKPCYLQKVSQKFKHICDVIMGTMASQITSLTIVHSTIHSGADQSKHQSSASLAFVLGIPRWPVNSPHKWPVTWKISSFDDVIMTFLACCWSCDCPACRTTLVATRFRVAVICPIIQVPHCIRVFFYFVWFVFINHIFQFYYELCTYCNILDIYLS